MDCPWFYRGSKDSDDFGGLFVTCRPFVKTFQVLLERPEMLQKHKKADMYVGFNQNTRIKREVKDS